MNYLPYYMKHLNTDHLAQLPSRKRAHLVNSVVGYKSIHLIGTHWEGWSNLCIVSTLTHLGSNPALLGFVLRPTTVPRHTYDILQKNPYFTVNNVTEILIEGGHQSSASYEEQVNEFVEVGLKEEWKNEFKAPYVQDSPIQLGCKWIREMPIIENGCRFLIGQIEEIYIQEALITENSDGFLPLENAGLICGSGMDGYYRPTFLHRRNYAQPNVPPHII